MSSARWKQMQQRFRDLQQEVENNVLALMPDDDELEVVDMNRDDGAYWFSRRDRRVRMELTVGKQVVVIVYDGDAEIRRVPGVIEAPNGLAELIVIALTKNL